MEDSAKAMAAENELRKFGNLLLDFEDKIIGQNLDLCDSSQGPDVVKLSSKPKENVPMSYLSKSENAMLSKVVLALTAICKEAEFCSTEARSQFFDQFLFYGEGGFSETDDSEAMKSIARMLPTIQKASCFADHCSEVVLNMVHQLSSLRDRQATSGAASFAASPDVHLQVVYEKLGKMLANLVIVDGIVLQHANLRGHWATYRRYIKAAMMNPEKYQVNSESMKKLEKLLAPAEAKVIDGNMFKTCVEQNFNKNGFFVTKNTAFMEEFLHCLRTMMTEIESEIQNGIESDYRLKLVSLVCLITLHNNLFHSLDKKFINRFWELCKKVPGVTLYGTVMWFPEQFVMAHLPAVAKIMEKKLVQTLASNRHTFLQNRATSSTLDTKQLHHQWNGWVIKMESTFRGRVDEGSGGLSLDHLQRAANLLLVGLGMASQARENVTAVLNLHSKLSIPLTKTSVIALCKATEVLKAIEATFQRHSLVIAGLIPHICQNLSCNIINGIARAKKSALSERKYTQTKLDILSALILAETTIAGASTIERQLVTRIALSFAAQAKTFKEDEMAGFWSTLKKLDLLSKIQENVEKSCNCSFLYWHRIIIPTYFEHIFDSKLEAYRLNYIFAALRDCGVPFSKAKHLETVLQDGFAMEIEGHLSTKIIDPLCRNLETDLRLQAHSHLQLDDRNPFKIGSLEDLAAFLTLPPIRFMGKLIDIKARVEAYLERTFYNLTTVALHNWRTYGEMRALASYKYGAETVDDHLPAQTLEQGLDVLVIMRNIHTFVGNYLYNLNNQIFVEAASPNKHVNTINIRHIANSIRTHGTGIMNTTVNFTYQFLRKKFGILSQFLYDDQIKSRLTKDARFFRENKAALEQKYPFDRASKFNKGIRKLGMVEGQTYLDQFRMLITQIGNAMGYVRMIKAGGLHYTANSIRFVPDLEDIPSFEDLAREEGFLSENAGTDSETEASAKMLDDVVQNLSKNFSDGTEYFQLLVEVFGKQLHEQKHPHLKNFYVIVPPLTINFVEHMIAAKERMYKNGGTGTGTGSAAFTDDGLAMGIAYVLRLLNQWQAFDSLHWFDTVRAKYMEEREKVVKQSREPGSDQKLQQSLALTLKRLDTYQKEFELLYFGLSSARIFFRSDLNESGDEEEEETERNSTISNKTSLSSRA